MPHKSRTVKINDEYNDRRDSTDEIWHHINLTSQVEQRSKVSILREIIQKQMYSSESTRSDSSGDDDSIYEKLNLTESYLVVST